MDRSRPRWLLIALGAAVLAAVTLGFLSWWRPHKLAEEHASRAQRALDEMDSHHANIALCSEALKQARLPSEKARYQSQIKSSRRVLAKLEEVAARHERLARAYGYKAPFRQK
jgi:type II secretory pathway component PulM